MITVDKFIRHHLQTLLVVTTRVIRATAIRFIYTWETSFQKFFIIFLEIEVLKFDIVSPVSFKELTLLPGKSFKNPYKNNFFARRFTSEILDIPGNIHGDEAVLSWHVQNFVGISYPKMELHQSQFSIIFELCRKIVRVMGAWLPLQLGSSWCVIFMPIRYF